MSDIFVSYASEDRKRIMPLVRALEKIGWSVFWDRTIPTGKTWREVIGSKIRSCRSIVVVWSNASVDSRWVQEEAEEGIRRHILFPVLLEDVDLPFSFGGIQAASLINWDGKSEAQEFRRLIADLTSVLGEPPDVVEEIKQKAQEEAKRKAKEEAIMNYDIFISYSHADKKRIRHLVKLLEQQGWTVWQDEPGITKGASYRQAINEALNTVRCVVVVWSKHSVNSEFVIDEAESGQKREVLIPIMIDEVEIPIGFRQKQFTKFTHWPPSSKDSELGRLLRAIAELIRKPLGEVEPEPGREEVSFDKLSKYRKIEMNKIMERYKSMITANPHDGEAHYRLALCYLHLRLYKLAIEHFKHALELLPDDPDTYYYYGLSIISGRRPKTLSLKDVRCIEEYLETAMQLDDRQAKYYYFAAILKYDYYLANGLRIDPPSPDELLSMAYEKDHHLWEVERLLQAVTLRDEAFISSIRRA